MPEAERRVSFFTQPVWKRAAVVAAGPIANFILAVVIFSGIFFTYGKLELLPRVDAVRPGEAAAEAGFQPGDLVRSVNGRPVASVRELAAAVAGAQRWSIAIERGGQEVTAEF